MKLVGMLDSPYVRRVAISLSYLDVDFTHEPLSVFTSFDEFKAINPVVKAPTVICDNGTILMDSSLILQYVETSMSHTKTLWPDSPKQLQIAYRAVGLALAACDKGVQLIYERNLRPKSAQYEPWLTRVAEQIEASLHGLESEMAKHPEVFQGVSHASILSAISWQFMSAQVSKVASLGNYPAMALLSANMESLPLFKSYPPDGPGIQAIERR